MYAHTQTYIYICLESICSSCYMKSYILYVVCQHSWPDEAQQAPFRCEWIGRGTGPGWEAGLKMLHQSDFRLTQIS